MVVLSFWLSVKIALVYVHRDGGAVRLALDTFLAYPEKFYLKMEPALFILLMLQKALARFVIAEKVRVSSSFHYKIFV